MRRMLVFLMLMGFAWSSQAQIVTVDPVFPTVDDSVTITFDATQGNAGLVDVQPVFMHTGVITELSGPGQWRYVQGNWGQYDPKVLMTYIGNNKHQITFHIKSFYGVPDQETVEQLAFVFRNEDGSKEGKTEDGSDIFKPVYSNNSDLLLARIQPFDDVLLIDQGASIPLEIVVSKTATIRVFDNGQVIEKTTDNNLDTSLSVDSSGYHEIVITAQVDNEMASDTFFYSVIPQLVPGDPPPGTRPGVNRINDEKVRIAFFAPGKEHVVLLGDFNDWQPLPEYFLQISEDGNLWWTELDSLDPNAEYRYQFLVDGNIRVADPFAEKILDPWNDQFIPESTYPNLIEYPHGKTNRIASVFTTTASDFDWDDDQFIPPPKEELVVYELLLSDFLAAHDYQTLTDTLDYLERLGVNAIELMPVSEFEGNISWGYNVSFHKALDKYYGTPEAFKTFINEAHNRGMAVILDIVLNHAFGQSPFARLYWDSQNNRPAPDNPWLNPIARHPFNVGADFNHESPATRLFVEEVLTHWLREFRVDGFRFDLSKGLTQQFSSNNAEMSAYDPTRIAIIQRMADIVWDENPDAYMILEHFATNSEERELSSRGMMLWRNMNYQYNEATMGYSSNLNGISYQSSGTDWNEPHLLGYMESHDEERLMYKNLEYGNSAGNYDISELSTALDRVALAAHFFITVPGPKMIWQFGELGYDFSINRCVNGTIDDDCRLDPKPIRWDYLDQPDRKELYTVFAELNHLRNNYDVFHTDNFTLDVSSASKQMQLIGDEESVVVVGNFNIEPRQVSTEFPESGWWYEYHSGDSLFISSNTENIALNPGEYRLYATKKLGKPDFITSQSPETQDNISIALFPNPGNGSPVITITNPLQSRMHLRILNGRGQVVYSEKTDSLNAGGTYKWTDPDLNLETGMYFIQIFVDDHYQKTMKWISINR